MNYRLGIDMGSTSIGWCMLEMDKQNAPCGIINMGVRIFPDGRDDKSKKPLSVIRREKRGQRRLYDRRRWRTQQLVNLLIQSSLLPNQESERATEFLKNPLLLRKMALDEKVSLPEFGRLLMHLSKHRGFKSNRKAEKGENTKSKYKDAIGNCKAIYTDNNVRTLGEYLWDKNKDLNEEEINWEIAKNSGIKPKKGEGNIHLKEPVRFRYEGAKTNKDIIFPTRDLLQDEFFILWEIQSRYHPELTNELKERIRHLIFEQMELKSQKHAIGYCYIYKDERRCPKADPLFQEFRLWQTINNLRVKDSDENIERALSFEEKLSVFAYLNSKASATYESLRKMMFSRNADRYRFTDETRKKTILGNETEAIFNAKVNSELLQHWKAMSSEIKSKVIDILVDNLDEEKQINQIHYLGLSHEISERLVSVNIPIRLEGYCRLSLLALNNLLPHMRQGKMYSEACVAIGKSHSTAYTGEIFDCGDLPYYGKLLKRQSIPLNRPSHEPNADTYGKINNPTVHVALNQLGKLVNALCVNYGPPKYIHLEMGKDVPMSDKERREIISNQNDNEKRNKKISDILSSPEINEPTTKLNILKYKLWEQISKNICERYCIYSGKNIGIEVLFKSEIEIDHILPKTKTYDDSMANKLLVFKDANKFKDNRTPFEAFHHNPPGYDWQSILSRASTLPDSKKWRFLNNAMEMFLTDKDPIARMMADTRYMAVAAREYLSYICGEDNVISCTGRLTHNLRYEWGLNSILNDDSNEKNRRDHRHHAIDAFVIACSDRSTVQSYANAIQESTDKFIRSMKKPYLAFSLSEVTNKINSIYVSYKPNQPNPQKMMQNNQTSGGLMKDTAYGLEGVHPNDSKYSLYTSRTGIQEITRKEVCNIVDIDIRMQLGNLSEIAKSEDEFDSLRDNWARGYNLKKVKILIKKTPITMVSVHDKKDNVYKYYESVENLFVDVFNPNPHDENSVWQLEISNNYLLHQNGYSPKWVHNKSFRTPVLIMRLFKNDVIAYTNDEGNREFRRLRLMSVSNGVLYFRGLNIAKKDDDIGEQFNAAKLQNSNACKAGIDVIGRAFDPLRGNRADNRA